MGKKWSGCVIVLLIVLYRITLGIDFTDEAYYAAMAVRFIRGDLPFVDELFVNQTGVLIVLPIVRLYYRQFGTEGIILFLRILYVLFCVGVGATAYLALKKRGKVGAALVAASLAVIFIPFNIPAPSYNTLGGGFFALAIFLALSCEKTGMRWKLAGAAMALALSEFAYPPLLVGAMTFSLCLLWHRKEDRAFTLFTLAWGHLAVGLLFLPYLLQAGSDLVDAIVYTWTAHHHGGGLAKLKYILEFWTPHATWYRLQAALLILPVALAIRKKFPTCTAALLTSFPAALFLAYTDAIFPSIWFFGYFALAAPLFYLLGARSDSARTLLFLGWLPSFAAGLAAGFASSSSPGSLVVGIWGGGIVSCFFFLEAIDHLLRTAGTRTRLLLPGLAQASVVAVFLTWLFVGTVFYCDGDYMQLTAKVRSGPFAGLTTMPSKKKYLEEITHDIHALENPNGKIVFYEFPAGYLLTRMRPAVNSAWMRTESLGKSFYVRHYQRHASPFNLVFAIRLIDHGFPSPIPYPPDDEFATYIRDSHRLILKKENYQVFAPKELTASAPSAQN